MTVGKLQVIEPVAYTPTSSVGGDTALANLYSPDPKEIFQASSTATRNIYLDMGVAVTLDSFFIGYHNGLTTETVMPWYDPGGGLTPITGTSFLRPADCKTVRANTLLSFSSLTSRYWMLQFSAKATALQVGTIVAGKSFECAWDREWGSGRRLIDTSKVLDLPSGGFGTQRGARKASYSWTFGDLTDAETETLWGMALRLGTSDPLVVCERQGAASGASEQLHYGLFASFDQFERREPSATKWALSITEWV